MKVDYTGRQCEITPAVRKQVEQGLNKIRKVLGDHFRAKVILTSEKYRQIAEITLTTRDRDIVGLARATDMRLAVGQALDRIERQALKYKGRWRTRKRQPRKKWPAAARETAPAAQPRKPAAQPRSPLPVVVHSFPSAVRAAETHVVPVHDAVALRPLTLEEAVKEAQFRDREVFVFRDSASGKVRVLHRTRDGRMELIEAP